MYLEILEELIRSYANTSKHDISILDVGCGNGGNVIELKKKGYTTFGTDVEFKLGPHTKKLLDEGYIKKIRMSATSRSSIRSSEDQYIWPFEDCIFNVVASRAVLEHVKNIDDFISENSRILRTGGLVIHYFPSKYSILEPHVGVPFGGILKNKIYYNMCARFGFFREKFKTNPEEALQYVRKYTEYRSNSAIVEAFEKSGFEYLGNHGSLILKYYRSGKYSLACNSKVISFLFKLFRSNVLVFRKS
ncbi:MAG: methyltransferase domain-containing protein [Pedobacter sp.]